METKEIDFKGDFELEGNVHNIEDVDFEKDLDVEVIEELPDLKMEEQIEVTLKKKREATRERLAYVFVIGVFTLLLIGAIFGFASNKDQVKNITDLLLAFSGILSGPLGFIVGYYFKRQEDEGK
ncbi:MAG: hypothetical protein ABIE03_02080 [Patescibacteria group bacterium]|nr:plasminogen receptor (KT) [Patescibacteria group bacterium]